MLQFRFIRFFSHLNRATLQHILDNTLKQRLPGLAAEMAYNAMLALFPAILAVLTAIGLVGVSQATFENLAEQLSLVAPTEVLSLIQNFVRQISRDKNQGLFSLSFVISLWAASGAISAAMTALDQIHQIPLARLRSFWKARLVSLALTVGTLLLLVTASTLVFISDVVVRIIAYQSGFLGTGVLIAWRFLSWPLALSIVAVAFAFIYRYGPSHWTGGDPIMPGAVLAAVFWAMISGLFRLYVGHFGHYNQAYGAIGAVIVLLLWLYLSALVMLVGAQINVSVGEAMRQQRKGRR